MDQKFKDRWIYFTNSFESSLTADSASRQPDTGIIVFVN